MLSPELIRMNLAVPGDAADAAAGTVAFVELEQLEHFLGPSGIFPFHAHPEIRTIRVVIHGKHFFGHALVKAFAGLVHNQINHGAGFSVTEVFLYQLGSAAGVDKMIKTDTGNIPLAQYVENFRDFRCVAFVDGEAQSDLDAFLPAVFKTFQGAAVGAGHPPELVMNLLAAVE